jgi:hypothetical protein
MNKCLIQSCKGKDSCLEHCPCDCHRKQFCDCYDHDFRRAVCKLAEIMDKQQINDSIRTTATMYVKTANEIDVSKYIRHLEEYIRHLEEEGRAVRAERNKNKSNEKRNLTKPVTPQ